jgi:hypothetical protein
MQNKATILQYTLFSCWFSQQMSYSNTLSFRPTKQNQANPLYTTFFIPLQQAPVLRKHMLIWAQQAKQKRLVPRKVVFLSVAPQPWNLGSHRGVAGSQRLERLLDPNLPFPSL